MNNIVRAWKDAVYRRSLSVEELAVLPASPVGEVELADVELEAIYGAEDSDSGRDREEITTVVSSSATMSQNGTAIGVSQIVLILPFVGAVPVGTQKNSRPCVASANASPHR